MKKTKSQDDAERAYMEALLDWNAKGKDDGNPYAYFFYAGAQYGLQAAKDAYSDSLAVATKVGK
jgi:hypothetical protein